MQMHRLIFRVSIVPVQQKQRSSDRRRLRYQTRIHKGKVFARLPPDVQVRESSHPCAPVVDARGDKALQSLIFPMSLTNQV